MSCRGALDWLLGGRISHRNVLGQLQKRYERAAPQQGSRIFGKKKGVRDPFPFPRPAPPIFNV